MSEARVFIVHDDGRFNLLQAEKFGRLIKCVAGHVTIKYIPTATALMRRALNDITTDDWLLPVGHPALIMAAGALQLEKIGRVRALIWRGENHKTGEEAKYIPVEII